jgi:hypothetical protein
MYHLIVLALALNIFLSVAPHALAATVPPPPPRLMINEVQTGGMTTQHTEDGRMEFIELYNPSVSTLDITNWQVEYLSAAHVGSTAPTRVLAHLSGTLSRQGLLLLSFPDYLPQATGYFEGAIPGSSGFLAKSGGHIRIVDNAGQTVDLLTWGTGVAIDDWARVPEIPAGQSINRVMPHDVAYVTGREYWPPTSTLTPQTGTYSPLFPPPISDPQPPVICSGIVLSEIMPNAQGSDAGHEFIEIYNPTTAAIRLAGCTLRLGTEGPVFEMPDELLDAGAYRAFFDSETNIVLPNSTAQPLILTTAAGQETILYPNDMKEDTSWAQVADVWQVTTAVTPAVVNEAAPLPPPVQHGTEVRASTPCPPGKERNTETNRCRATESVSAPTTACKAGQERNPATNRCRNVVQLASNGPAPCKAGQERNTETNRCRAVLAAETSKTCAAGQERNPATNRCRKVVPPTKSIASVHDVSAGGPAANDYKWWLGGMLLLGIAGYAIYEWRHDVVNIAHKYKIKWPLKGIK